MATSYIRADGTGDYILPSAWFAFAAGTTGALIPVYNDGTPGQLAGVSFDHGIVTAHVVVPSP
jgi:hypothetical protein